IVQVLALCSFLCLLRTCWGKEIAAQKFQKQEKLMEPLDFVSDDLKQEGTVWRLGRPWNLWTWGRLMLNKALGHSSANFESDYEGRAVHRDRPNGILKNNLKFFLKIKQFDT
ncbi:uncharacterized protein LOC114248357, partial [Bombyx mandarina]|uniref:Uncharacterized protein LOC114248357 n=1 Tax=Bombyx mandarina TaxID=7092 RepID=A0A6J2K505_BOMMA